MLQFFLTGLVLAIGIGSIYQFFIAPRKWMKMYGDGNYNPLRRTYQNASKK